MDEMKNNLKKILYIVTVILCFHLISGCSYDKSDCMKRNIVSLINQLEKNNSSFNNPVSRKLFSDSLDKLASYGYGAVSILNEELIKSKNAECRLIIIGALSKIGGNESEKILIKYVTDNDAKVRSGVAIGLRGFSSIECSEALIHMASNDANPQVKIAAILSLGSYNNEKVIYLLKSQLDNKHPDIREAAEYSIEKLTNIDFIPKRVLFPKTLLDRQKELDYFEALENNIKASLDKAKSKEKTK